MQNAPEWVILSSAPVALRWTRMSLERASRVRGTRAPDFAILVLLSSEARTNPIQKTGHGGNGVLELTMSSQVGHTSHCVALHFDIGAEHLPDKRFEATKFHDE